MKRAATEEAAAGAPPGKVPRGDAAAEPPAAPPGDAAAEAPAAGGQASEAEARAAAAEEMAAFERVRKNRIVCLSQLAKLAQRIERVWDADPGLRLELLAVFRDALLSLEGHKDGACANLSGLGRKMKSLDMDLRHFLTMALPIERTHTRGLRDHEFLVTRPDDLAKAEPAAAAGAGESEAEPKQGGRMPLVLVLDNLRSAFNVGSLFRTAECLRVQKMYLCGYTATPTESGGQTAKASMGTDAHVPWEHRERVLPVLEELRAAGMEVVSLETEANAVALHKHTFSPAGVALVLGNERHGLEADVLAASDAVVRIPCRGVKNSLNVGVATAICGYEIARQWGWGEGAEP